MDFKQVVGCAYTYQPSLAMRKRLTRDLKVGHSSQERDFSYFYKGNQKTVVGNGQDLFLSRYEVDHWPEAELALVLGREHQIVGITVANDFTAIGIEAKGVTKEFDGTYLGKVWKGSCSLDSRVVHDIDINNLNVGLRIERDGEVIYDHTYNTKRRKRDFNELARMVVDYHKEFGEDLPLSKRVEIKDGFLSEGTVLLAGTGLIVPRRCYNQEGDIITVYCREIGELVNTVRKKDPR